MTDQPTAGIPPFTATEARDRSTFLALMWALSYPGRVQMLPIEPIDQATDPAIVTMTLIGQTLLDLETSFFSPSAPLVTALSRTGARHLPEKLAAYHFYPALAADQLPLLAMADPGTAQYPDQGATICLGCQSLDQDGAATTLIVSGPGVNPANGPTTVRCSGIPRDFWALRDRVCRYPLGWDVFLVDPHGKLIGLPRTVSIEQASGGAR